MTRHNVQKTKQIVGFFSMTLAWALMNVVHSFYLVSLDGVADDSGVVLFWSGFFVAAAWLVFIIYPLHRLNPAAHVFKPHVFPLATTVYAALVYAILVGGVFRSLDVVLMFLPWAACTGFLFGLCFSLLIRSGRVVNLIDDKLAIRLVLVLSPALILGVFLWLLPACVPSWIFRYTTDEVRTRIIRQTIPVFRVGDDFEPLRNALPGYLDHIEHGHGNMYTTMEDFAFVIEVNCGKITRLEYGQSQFDIDGTMNATMSDSPCP